MDNEDAEITIADAVNETLSLLDEVIEELQKVFDAHGDTSDVRQVLRELL